MPQSVMVNAIAVLVLASILLIFYTAIRTKWPENYVTATKDFGLVVNRSLLRYFAFVVVPPYLASLIVTTTASRSDGDPLLIALLGGSVYLLRSHIRHVIALLRDNNKGHTRLPAIIVAVTAIAATLAACVFGSLGPGPFPALVPDLSEYFKSLWTTVLLALIAVVLINGTKRSVEIDDLVARSRREIGPQALIYTREQATANGTDVVLAEAILLAENLERPSWVRWLEQLKGRVSPAGTYGVMQVYADRPISDIESIGLAMMRLGEVNIKIGEDGWYSTESLKEALRTYNDNPDFVDLASSIYSSIFEPRELAAEEAEEPALTDIDARIHSGP